MADDAQLRDYLKRAIADVQTLKGRLHEVESARREPIAIVGMACRFPAGSPRRRTCGTWSPPGATR